MANFTLFAATCRHSACWQIVVLHLRYFPFAEWIWACMLNEVTLFIGPKHYELIAVQEASHF